MSSKVTVKLQLCARDRGDGANGDIACSVNTLRSCMVYSDFFAKGNLALKT